MASDATDRLDPPAATETSCGADADEAYPRPLVKWAGGKRGIIPQLQDLMPSDVRPGFQGRLVEPFVGGAAMFFYLKPREALLADLNPDLVNLYVQLRDRFEKLVGALDDLNRLDYSAESYYAVRDKYRSESYEEARHSPEKLVERAAQFVFLNKWGWNGLYRVNKRGEFNVPFGRNSSGTKPVLYELRNLRSASDLLQRADLRIASFEETLAEVRENDFVYLDPPYHPLSTTSAFTSYTKLDFSLDDQRRLRDAILETHVRTKGRARIMLSNSVAPDLVELYEHQAGLCLHTVVAFRGISAKASSRGAQPELVVTNYCP